MLALGTVLLGGCLDGQEEMFIGKDGTARVRAVYRVPAAIFSAGDAEQLRKTIAEEIGDHEHLELITNTAGEENGERVITLEIKTDDVMALENALPRHAPGEKISRADRIWHTLVGKVSVGMEGLSVSMSRDVNLGPVLEKHLGKNGAALMGDAEFRYVIHLPEAAQTSNAHEIVNDGRTLRWTYRLRECGSKPIELRFVAPVPVPWWAYALIALLFVVIAWGVRAVVVRLRSSNARGCARP